MFESLFQSFIETADPSKGAERAKLLRAQMAQHHLDGFIIPRSDEHQNEYVPACAERLAWLTGFTGSAGLAIVLQDQAAVFVDGRYTLQVRDQVDTKVFAPIASAECSPEQWISDHLKPGARLGYDPWLTTQAQMKRYEAAVAKAGGELFPTSHNLIDAIWQDRPAPPQGLVRLYPKALSGLDAATKLKRIAKSLSGLDGLLISDPHAMAWAFNIRGSDVPHTPLPLGFAFISKDGSAKLYLEEAKLSPLVRKSLARLAQIAAPQSIGADLEALGQAKRKIRFDAASAPARLIHLLTQAGGQADVGADPIALMKAKKSEAELAGARAAHIRDGAAMVNFLAWFDEAVRSGPVSEIDAVKALETFRRKTGLLREVSFPTISGAGAHGAIVHYRVTEASNIKIGKGLFLLDSGAQYEDGTTDITRTIAVGKPSAEMRDRFTRVLKGHIAIARAVFPKGTSGTQLDSFARAALWQAGLDYDHGTGHGVGAFLSVHEGPQRISKVASVALEPGMILSNEPGYYKTNAYGIRIENLIAVVPKTIAGAERDMLGFETLTLSPIDLRLIDQRLLNADEIQWLNAYHKRVRQVLLPLIETDKRHWLREATRSFD